MDAAAHNDEHGNTHDRDEHPGPNVDIFINGQEFTIHRGSQTVTEIKAVGSVPLADDLEQNVNGLLTPLPDDGRVTIKGGERFVSHPKDSGASHG